MPCRAVVDGPVVDGAVGPGRPAGEVASADAAVGSVSPAGPVVGEDGAVG
jgi:hypothetical protein